MAILQKCKNWIDKWHIAKPKHQEALKKLSWTLPLPAGTQDPHPVHSPKAEADQQPPPEECHTQATDQTKPGPDQAPHNSELAASSTDLPACEDNEPFPLFSPMVNMMQHHAFCTLFDLHSCPQVEERFKDLDLTCVPYQKWWATMVTTRTLAKWRMTLWKSGAELSQVEEADEHGLGMLFFHHMGFDGRYHAVFHHISPQQHADHGNK